MHTREDTQTRQRAGNGKGVCNPLQNPLWRHHSYPPSKMLSASGGTVVQPVLLLFGGYLSIPFQREWKGRSGGERNIDARETPGLVASYMHPNLGWGWSLQLPYMPMPLTLGPSADLPATEPN